MADHTMTMSDLNYRASHRRKSASGVKSNKARSVGGPVSASHTPAKNTCGVLAGALGVSNDTAPDHTGRGRGY